MPLNEVRIAGYRSLRDVRLAIGNLNVLVGANGTGKSNLYRALLLLHSAARGGLARALGDEGGMPSALWAGSRKKGPVRLRLGVSVDGFSYDLSCGLPELNDLPSAFALDPLVKEETVTWSEGRGQRAVTLLDRGKSGATLRDAEGRPVSFPMTLTRGESALSQVLEPQRFPHVAALRETLSRWRFYEHFRTDAAAPLRQPQVGVFTPVLSHDGRDLAAALQTIIEIGDADGLFRAVRRGLGGASLRVATSDDGARFRVLLETAGLLRPLEAWELSDGTLRFLCLLAALMSPRPPALLALNEPEASLHPDLLPPLAELITEAAKNTQVWVTTHSRPLADEIERRSGAVPVLLVKEDGETRVRA
jgi:predicted ATPase